MGRTAAAGERLSKLDGAAPESTDFANYFCTYAYLYHQVGQRQPRARAGAAGRRRRRRRCACEPPAAAPPPPPARRPAAPQPRPAHGWRA
jgi:hypothetical protein